MELSTRYNPQETEGKWYKHWMEKNYFHSEPDERDYSNFYIVAINEQGDKEVLQLKYGEVWVE